MSEEYKIAINEADEGRTVIVSITIPNVPEEYKEDLIHELKLHLGYVHEDWKKEMEEKIKYKIIQEENLKRKIEQTINDFHELTTHIAALNEILLKPEISDEQRELFSDSKVFYVTTLKRLVTRYIHSWPPEIAKSANEYLGSC